MSDIKIRMLKIYKPDEFDWMNYKIKNKSDLTLHHIQKKADGGPKEVGNLALLVTVAHQYLHLIECKDPETYNSINKILYAIALQETPPTEGQRYLVEELLSTFEQEHKNDKGSKGKSLIQYKYKQRW